MNTVTKVVERFLDTAGILLILYVAYAVHWMLGVALAGVVCLVLARILEQSRGANDEPARKPNR